jgi:hypothetical protein
VLSGTALAAAGQIPGVPPALISMFIIGLDVVVVE